MSRAIESWSPQKGRVNGVVCAKRSKRSGGGGDAWLSSWKGGLGFYREGFECCVLERPEALMGERIL